VVGVFFWGCFFVLFFVVCVFLGGVGVWGVFFVLFCVWVGFVFVLVLVVGVLGVFFFWVGGGVFFVGGFRFWFCWVCVFWVVGCWWVFGGCVLVGCFVVVFCVFFCCFVLVGVLWCCVFWCMCCVGLCVFICCFLVAPATPYSPSRTPRSPPPPPLTPLLRPAPPPPPHPHALLLPPPPPPPRKFAASSFSQGNFLSALRPGATVAVARLAPNLAAIIVVPTSDRRMPPMVLPFSHQRRAPARGSPRSLPPSPCPCVVALRAFGNAPSATTLLPWPRLRRGAHFSRQASLAITSI